MKERIIVVDRNPDHAKKLCDCLAKFGTKALVLKNSVECLAKIAQGNIAMVFIEAGDQDKSGFEILKELRQKYNLIELPIIMVADQMDDDIMTKAIVDGANDFLSKPADCTGTIARIYHQLLALELHKQSLKDKSCEILSAMIATYNHEINNALAVAFTELDSARKSQDSTALQKVFSALKTIRDIILKIKRLPTDEVEETSYLLGGKMIKLTPGQGTISGSEQKTKRHAGLNGF